MSIEDLVSVVIPSYKRPHMLGRALKSVLSQTYDNLEIIVVNDDPETDLDRITVLDDRIKLINHEKNRGAPAARNTGIKNSTGEYIAFLDDDDEWLPEKIEKQVKKFEELDSNYGIVYCWWKIIKKEKTIEKTPEKKGDIYPDSLQSCPATTSATMLRKEVFDNVGPFNTELQSHQEWDMWFRTSKKYKFSYIPEILMLQHRTHLDRISANINRHVETWDIIMEKYKDEFEKHPSILHQKTKAKGVRLGSMGANSKICSRFFKKSLEYGDKDIMSLIYLMVSKFPTKMRKYFFKKIIEYYQS